MNRQQIEWAREHDWFVGTIEDADGKTHSILVDDRIKRPRGTVTDQIARFSDFDDLKRWAGY